jgi:predicted ArsR family transcriptional regulator
VPNPDAQLAEAAILAEPVRRALYLYVARQPGEVSRDQAARAVAITRSLAAYHLDKLVRTGLLEAGYRRLHGRGGPGAGRPSKLYRRSGRDLRVAVPARDYELLARLAVRALDEGGRPEDVREVARGHGTVLGSRARDAAGPRPDRERLARALVSILSEGGFEPVRRDGEIRLRNCPFDALATSHRDLVCGMNLALLEGVLQGLGPTGFRAEPRRGPDWCCVAFRTQPPATRSPAG